MKTKFLIVFMSVACSVSAYAQPKSLPGVRFLSYGGVGYALPSSEMKANSMIGNGVNFSLGHFHALTKGNGVVRVGFEAKFHYSKFVKDLGAPSSVRSIRYENGSGAPVKVSLRVTTNKKRPDAHIFLAGPSVLLTFDRFFLQPSLTAGVAYVAQEEFRFHDNVFSVGTPVQDTTINFYTSGHETNNGFAIVPGVKAGYRFLKNFAAFVSIDYMVGFNQEFTDWTYVPAGTPDPQTGYDYYQVTHGTTVESVRESPLRVFLLNFNVAFTLPDKK